MDNTITPRYGHDPRCAFAATRAFAARTRSTKAAAGRTRRLLRFLTGR